LVIRNYTTNGELYSEDVHNLTSHG